MSKEIWIEMHCLLYLETNELNCNNIAEQWEKMTFLYGLGRLGKC